MTKREIKDRLERIYSITLTTEIINGSIFTTVHCPYWVRKSVTFPMSHNANDFTENQAALDHIPNVLKMAGIGVTETLNYYGF